MSSIRKVKGQGRMINHVPKLLAEQYGGKHKINIAQVARDLQVTEVTARNWITGEVSRYDEDMIVAWCNYFGITDVSLIFEYVPPRQPKPVAEPA